MSLEFRIRVRSAAALIWVVLANITWRRPMLVVTLVRGDELNVRCENCGEIVIHAERE